MPENTPARASDTATRDVDELCAFRDAGDVKALGRLFDRTAPKLMLLAMHLTHDSNAAEELLQATFVSAMQSASTFDCHREVMPLLTGILAHRAADMRAATARLRRLQAAAGEKLPIQSRLIFS